MSIGFRKHWVFDLDGTLTVAIHDFDAIRRELGLSPGQPILEQLERLSPEEATRRRRRLDEIEVELVDRAEMQDGATELLEFLESAGCRFGVLTRNTRHNAWSTLERVGLARYFAEHWILGRECCAIKPSGDGVRLLMDRWAAKPDDTVMVGDYLFDLQAGRDAGAATIYVDTSERFEHARWADAAVSSLSAIATLLR